MLRMAIGQLRQQVPQVSWGRRKGETRQLRMPEYEIFVLAQAVRPAVLHLYLVVLQRACSRVGFKHHSSKHLCFTDCCCLLSACLPACLLPRAV